MAEMREKKKCKFEWKVNIKRLSMSLRVCLPMQKKNLQDSISTVNNPILQQNVINQTYFVNIYASFAKTSTNKL